MTIRLGATPSGLTSAHLHHLSICDKKSHKHKTSKCLPIWQTDRHPFNGLFSRTIWESRHQKVKPFRILMKQEMMRWHWHQLDQMQIICPLLHTDNHAST